MQKKAVILISALVLIALAGAGYVIYGRPVQDAANEIQETGREVPSGGETVTAPQAQGTGLPDPAETAEEPEKTEEIPVDGNTPEYELKASLNLKASAGAYIKLQYYQDGSTVVKELGQEQIPEFKELYKKREEDRAGSTEAFKIKKAYLNAKYAKVYFILLENQTGDQFLTSIYSCSLADGTVKKLFSQVAGPMELYPSKDLKYIGYSYYDSPASSIHQEKTLFQLLRCSDDAYLVEGSRVPGGGLIGDNKDTKNIYDYTFIKWKDANTVTLGETAYPKGESGKGGTREVTYDVDKNVFLNADGSVVKAADGKKEEQQVKADSEPVKVLKDFYGFLSAEQYPKAYDILDDKFMLDAFKLLGATELTKKDIDIDSFAMYGSLFKAARLQGIVLEKTEADKSAIYFYQIFSMGEGQEAKQALVANLVKTQKGWKISSVKDGNANEKPFK